jgi:ribosomal protein S18 acetylase RimI-like enzyme
MTQPGNYEAARQRVSERFASTIEEERLTVSELLDADQLLSEYGDQIKDLSQEAFRHNSPEEAREWVETCAQQLGFRAVVLTNQQGEVAGFTWGATATYDANDLGVASQFVETQRAALDVDEGEVVYSTALAIAPNYRERGLGSGLALAAIKLCREQLHSDGALLFFRTRPDNPAANHASQILGAEQTGFVSPANNKRLWFGYIPPADVA